MDNSRDAASLKKLVEAFGWNRNATFVQQDIQEFCCLLIDNLEQKFASFTKFKNPFHKSAIKQESEDANLIKSLFNGQTESLIECRNVDFVSRRTESFLDIQLSLKTFQKRFFCLKDSLRQHLAAESLEGDNKYQTDDFGKQDADKRVRFLRLPKILMFHLRRSEYDFQLDMNTKVKHRFEFPRELNMDDFKDKELQTGDGHPFRLLGIFVHHGMEGVAGHYTVLIEEEDGWYEYDDETARKVDWEYVKENAYGGDFDEIILDRNMRCVKRKSKRNTHAYMLIYIDKKYEKEILNCKKSNERKKIGLSLRNYMKQVKNENESLFVSRCQKEKSFQKFANEITQTNNQFYKSQLIEISVMSPWQIIGEPTARGAVVSSQYQKDLLSHQRAFKFQKKVSGQDITEIIKKEIEEENRVEAPVLVEPRPTREMMENERLMKAQAERIQIERNSQEKKYHKSGFLRKTKDDIGTILKPLLKDTPKYLNFVPQKQKRLNVLHQNRHILSSDFLEKVYNTQNPINIDKINFFKSNFEGSSCAFNTFVTPNLSFFSLKLHMLSLIYSKKYRLGFGLRNLNFDKSLFKNPESEEYLDFTKLNPKYLKKILSAFEFYQLTNLENLTMHKLNLDTFQSFTNSFKKNDYSTSSLAIFAVPVDFIQSSESPFFSHKYFDRNIFDVRNILSLNRVLSSQNEQSFNSYSPKNLFSLQIKLPFMSNNRFKERIKQSFDQSFSSQGSLNLDSNQIFADYIKINNNPRNFEKIDLNQSFMKIFGVRKSNSQNSEPIVCEGQSKKDKEECESDNLLTPRLLTLQKPKALVQIKIFLPHLNVLYTYGFLRIESGESAEMLSRKVGLFIGNDNIFIFKEKLTNQKSYSEQLFANLTLLPISTSHSGITSIWSIIKQTLTKKFEIDFIENNEIKNNSSKKKISKKRKEFKLNHNHVESLIVIPSTVFFIESFQEMSISPSQSQKKQKLKKSEKILDSKSTLHANQNKNLIEVKNSDNLNIDLETQKNKGKRSEPGLLGLKKVDETNSELDKIMKKIKINKTDTDDMIPETNQNLLISQNKIKEIESKERENIKTPLKNELTNEMKKSNPSQQLKLSLLYLELTQIFAFLNLYHKFCNYKYMNLIVPSQNIQRNLIISNEWDNETIFQTIYGKVFQEQNFFKKLMNDPSPILMNGHFYYANFQEDPAIQSILNSNFSLMNQPSISFEYITLWAFHQRRNKLTERISQTDFFKVKDKEQLKRIFKSDSLQPFRANELLLSYKENSIHNEILKFAIKIQDYIQKSKENTQTAEKPETEFPLDQLVYSLCRNFKKSIRLTETENLITDWIDSCQNRIWAKLNFKIQTFNITMIPLFRLYDLKFTINVPEENFTNKMELISDIICKNDNLVIALFSDEPDYKNKDKKETFKGAKFSWFNNLNLRSILFSSEREKLHEFKDLKNLREIPLSKEHFETNFRDILLSNMFEVLNFDLFQGGISDFMLYPTNDGFADSERKYLPSMFMMKVLVLTPQFLHSWILGKKETRNELTSSISKRYHKQFQRARKMVLKRRFISKARRLQINESALEVTMYNLFPYLKLVFIYVVDMYERISGLPRVLFVPGCIKVSEMYSIILKLFEENIRFTMNKTEGNVIEKVFLRTDEGNVDYEEVSELRIDDHDVNEDIYVKFILMAKNQD